jgi:hypothetical protein
LETKKMEESAKEVLSKLEELQSQQELTILKLSEPINKSVAAAVANNENNSKEQRGSDASSLDAVTLPTPASLESDLTHYRELFAKLRFSYVEQVTKEKFIRAIVGEPPQIVTAAEIATMEESNSEAKAALKALKTEVISYVEDLESRGRELAIRHEAVGRDGQTLRDLPGLIASLQADVEVLRRSRDPTDTAPDLNLPLAKTRELIVERQRKSKDLDTQLAHLSAQVPRKRKEVDHRTTEIFSLEARRQNSAVAATDARKRKEARLGGVADDLEERGRWWRAEELILKNILEV